MVDIGDKAKKEENAREKCVSGNPTFFFAPGNVVRTAYQF